MQGAPVAWNVHKPLRADGTTVLVTGGNAGIGYFIAEQLATAGATVIIGSRSPAKAAAAVEAITARVRGSQVQHIPLDLTDLASLRASVSQLDTDALDAVVLNAGIALDEPPRKQNRRGHELMFATNHLGHFALVHWLAPWLEAAPAARIVTMGSFAARSERLDLDDLQSVRDYDPKRTYGRSKLAQMTFAFELDRRLRAAGSTCMSVIAHPGGALDALTPPRPGIHQRSGSQHLLTLPAKLLVQGKDAGAWPAVRATIDPDVQGGQLWGPSRLGLSGKPHLETPHPHMTDQPTGQALWTASTQLTRVEAFTS
ncbi:SDR family NAD(P)-dependent oxidoreductase [Streptomyces sp. AM 2-1-1]|uniref:SDR family NAD(P)-dependent oxidoreductase n=1 Tax=Streptomyces sp. AM 2-1-1 TaxID=3028709 RepID=UPI0023B886D8|nr:SDR family NAD(P)-dependent oxidoreductase [Streptomyces sp. AM 2-1-1]WEH43927.1 SDR family NAD(P)-dependent oxidoreductase [Streptomyces sp. AM 2-1-1]